MTEDTRRKLIRLATALLPDDLANPEASAGLAGPKRKRLLCILCAAVFLVALGVRALYWHDNRLDLETTKGGALSRSYQEEARRIADEGGILFPRGSFDPGDVRMIIHPPGYSILIAALSKLSTNPLDLLIATQIVCDSIAVVFVMLIASELLLPHAVAILAALIAALSPHFSFHSVSLLPDSLPAPLILLAVYFVARATKKRRLRYVILAGALAGLSCWLRANALLLAPFLALPILISVRTGKRWVYGAVLVSSMMIVIAPIMVRNALLFRSFVPLSVTAGLTLIEGIADYDPGRKFGMPRTDGEAAPKDAEWFSREDYRNNLWRPDGIERDKARFARGLQVVRSNPIWFFGVGLRRAGFMLRYDSAGSDWPLNTASVPLVSVEPGFGHRALTSIEMQPDWEKTPSELIKTGEVLSHAVGVSSGEELQTMLILFDDSGFGDQFCSEPIPVKRNTDYVITLPARLMGGKAAVKVTSSDRRIALASTILRIERKEITRKQRKRLAEGGDENPVVSDERTHLPFASGERDEVKLVLSKNGITPERAAVQLGQVCVFDFGTTPQIWTRYPRALVRGLQKNLFTTSRLLPSVVIGFVLLLVSGRLKALSTLLAVPLYYLCVQSALHTEYRYILVIHYFLFMLAGTTLYFLATVIWRGVGQAPVFLKWSARGTAL